MIRAHQSPSAARHARRSAFKTLALGGALFAVLTLLASAPAAAGPCQKSAKQARKACRFDVKDNLFEQRAICAHISGLGDREECLADADDEADEGGEECQDVFDARVDFCAASGEHRYDPDFKRGMFTDVFANQNPYWLLSPGNEWTLEDGDETIVVRVLPATKRIGKVDCIVVNDVVSEDGELIEDTDDWYGQAKNGDVWYCGENAKDYEYFDGDQPREAELVEIDGSFKHGVNGAKAGIAMFAAPRVGDVYRQEFALGDAEDGAEVLSTTYSYGDGSGLDRRVPRELAELMCNGDCVVTRDFNLLEPGGTELKYYAPGIGVFLEVSGRDVVRLVECNVDPRCDEL